MIKVYVRTRMVLRSQPTKNSVVIRLLTCLLLLGVQPWFVGLQASDLPTGIFELGALPSEAEDQNEGPDGDADLDLAALQGFSLRSACGLGSALVADEPGFDRSGLSLLPVAGLQPSAP